MLRAVNRKIDELVAEDRSHFRINGGIRFPDRGAATCGARTFATAETSASRVPNGVRNREKHAELKRNFQKERRADGPPEGCVGSVRLRVTRPSC